MTRDQGITHKLKPRSFIKVMLCSNIFFCLLKSSFCFSIITKYYLFSKVVHVREYSEVSQNTLVVSGGSILSWTSE